MHPNKAKYIAKEPFVASVLDKFAVTETEIADRNEKIRELDEYIYGNRLEKSLSIPIGHDFTPVNWLKRTVEVHKSMFMSRGFQLISTYDTQDASSDQENAERIGMENKKEKAFSEERKRLIDSIIRDNGGFSMWIDLAETAGAVGDAAVKTYYDEKAKKFVISPIESVDNLRVLWKKDDFREMQAVAYVYQIPKETAVADYGVSSDCPTSPLGQPLVFTADSPTPNNVYSTQPMVTVLEITGTIEGWRADKNTIVQTTIGSENEFNALIVGDKVVRVISDTKKMPRYYLFPNKRQRRRPWGVSDVTDAAIKINMTYIETLSDWRTVSAKVNFPKYKAFGFGMDTQMPKSESRKIQMIPLSGEGQDLVPLDQGNPDKMDFRAQMEELKEQFVRETGVSRVLFDDPSVTLNSNQALLTSMKPTSDIAESKKQLWGPIIERLFMDALETIGQHNRELSDLTDGDFELKVMWPSVMQKEDPVYQQMLLNRFNSNTISLQTFLEQQGESKEEIDRIRDEMEEPLTAAILGRVLNLMAEQKINPPSNEPQVKTNISLRGDLTPQQEANHATTLGLQDGPFPPSMGPQGEPGRIAQLNVDNEGLLEGEFPNQTPINRGPDGQPVGMQKQDTNTGQQSNAQMTTPAQNQEGQGVMSQPGSGATTTSPQGAINQANQNAGN